MAFLVDFGLQPIILARLLDFTVESSGHQPPFVHMTIGITSA